MRGVDGKGVGEDDREEMKDEEDEWEIAGEEEEQGGDELVVGAVEGMG